MQDRVMLLADSSEDEFWAGLEFNRDIPWDYYLIFYVKTNRRKRINKWERTVSIHLAATRPLVQLPSLLESSFFFLCSAEKPRCTLNAACSVRLICSVYVIHKGWDLETHRLRVQGELGRINISYFSIAFLGLDYWTEVNDVTTKASLTLIDEF